MPPPSDPSSDPSHAATPEGVLARIVPELLAGADGRGVRVALLDGGVDFQRLPPTVLVSETVAVREGPPGRDGRARMRIETSVGGAGRQHGSAVAGIVASLAPRAELLAVDVTGTGSEPTVDVLVEGIRWAVGRGCRVINISRGPARPDLPPGKRMALLEAVERAWRRDAVIVAGAHPSHPSVPAVPATFAVPVAVRRGDWEDPLRFLYRPEARIEFEARGRPARLELRPDQRTTGGSGSGSAIRFAASSAFAAPHVSGHAARILSACPDLRPFEVKTVLYRVAEAWRLRDLVRGPANGG